MATTYDRADLWAMGLWRLYGSMSNGPLEQEPWWQEWQEIRRYIEQHAAEPRP